MHGASAYEKDIRTEVKMKPQARRGKVPRASLGDVGGPKSLQAGPFRRPRAVLVVQVAQEVVQENQQNRTATRAKRYAQRGPADMRARHHTKHSLFEAPSKAAKTLAEGGRAKRYGQCHFVDMSALKRIMAQERVNFVGYLANLKPSRANIKTLKNQWKYV